jgi:hypothetical protein
MSHDSIRNKNLVQFPDGGMMLFCETSCSNVTSWDGKRCWDICLFHPQGSLFYTKETLKQEQENYVNNQLETLRKWNKESYERGWAKNYEEPTLESYDYGGTVFPCGSKIKHGRAFFSGRKTVKAEEFFGSWDAPKRITFSCCDKDYKTTYEETFDILRADLDECYKDALKKGTVYIGIH